MQHSYEEEWGHEYSKKLGEVVLKERSAHSNHKSQLDLIDLITNFLKVNPRQRLNPKLALNSYTILQKYNKRRNVQIERQIYKL